MFSAPPSKLGWWVTLGERLGLVSAIREKSFRLELRLGSCSPERRAAVLGAANLLRTVQCLSAGPPRDSATAANVSFVAASIAVSPVRFMIRRRITSQ